GEDAPARFVRAKWAFWADTVGDLGGRWVADFHIERFSAMKRTLPSLTRVGLALLVPAWLLAVPASAQETKAAPAPAAGGGETKSAPSGGSSGTSAPAGNSGGQTSGGFGGGFSRGDDGRRGGSTGGT